MFKTHTHTRCTRLALALAATLLLIACSKRAVIGESVLDVSFKTLSSAEPLPIGSLGKPLLVNFWSTTCIICLKEMPHLAEIYKEFEPRGFEMVAVAMSFDRPSDVVQLSEQSAWPFLVAIDLDDKIAKSLGDIQFTPTAFLIGEDGKVLRKYVGAIDLAKFRETLEALTVQRTSQERARETNQTTI